MEKRVSVILPAYNVESYIEEAVKSILFQSYGNIEVVVVDDGSCDNTYGIVSRIAKCDSRVVTIRNSENCGIAFTLNVALSHSTGEYIVRMDGDDVSEENRVERLIDFLEKNACFDIVGCSMVGINKEGDVVNVTEYSSSEDTLVRTLKYGPPLAHIWCARKSVYEALNGYREVSGVEDYDFLLRANAEGFRFTNIPDYFGYKVRVFREGNSAELHGVKQIKLKRYVYKLYRERLHRGEDSFSPELRNNYTKTTWAMDRLHVFSNRMLRKYVIEKRRKPFMCYFFLILSLVSPYQIFYLKDRFMKRVLQ
ncbi:glycosyltransferase family 2 protein [Halomonas sp. DP1Y21-3]|uniref:glycosyltransferase family 2 protein n=1 Tax=Halomonas sp. DP1Y21-3 TaxID=2859080 RepID=UPI001C97CF9F|nr:glycosyltransferase family 2 protein [Halomonas sp. DP1Y21-3]MBY6112812.1 glycosyltransferase family 2 protein [Halomonas sp. DP1Y21-3]